jgi:phosphoribosylglycinamide formyltransferase 1
MLKVGVLISGRGSNLKALIDAASGEGYPAQIACVIADKEAAGLDHARKAGIPAFVVDRKAFADRQSFEEAVSAKFVEHEVKLICLAGFMRILSSWFVNEWLDRLINIHPSLLPSFPGLEVQKRAVEEGVKFSGCTVHFVRPKMDAGPIIIQAVVPVLQDDDEHTLADRILVQEHKIYSYAVKLIAQGRVNIHNERTFIADASVPEAVSNPLV